MKKRVVITGTGLISSLGDCSSELFDGLCNGVSGIHPTLHLSNNGCGLGAELPAFRGEMYLAGRSLRPLDRASQLASAACGLALEQSGWDGTLRRHFEVSLVLGTMMGGMHTIGDFDRAAITEGPAAVSPMAFANTVINAAAGQCAIWHDLRGINTTIATGSTSGIRAVSHACDLVRHGRANVVLAGGVDEFSTESYYGFAKAGLLCTNGIQPYCPVPFDKGRNGFALGEGAAFLVLEEFSCARARGAKPSAEILGCATAFDSSQGQDSNRAIGTMVRTMKSAIERSGLPAKEIGFISASANGSVTRDDYEIAALAATFEDYAAELPVTAIKAYLGEPLGASGPIQVASAVESFRQGRLPGIKGLKELPAGCPLCGISPNTRELAADTALINGVGLDGNCCSLVIKRFE